MITESRGRQLIRIGVIVAFLVLAVYLSEEGVETFQHMFPLYTYCSSAVAACLYFAWAIAITVRCMHALVMQIRGRPHGG